MKTKNNVQKTILRSVAVIVSFVLISYTVSAQDFWKKLLAHSSFNEIAIAMAETSNNSVDSENSLSGSFFLTNAETDSPMELENWMLDEDHLALLSLQFDNEAEGPLELEAWMWQDYSVTLDAESEKPLELESWMTSPLAWNN